MNILKLSKIFNKQILYSIVVIIVISGLLGFIYNILQPTPLPLVYTPKHIDTVDNSFLFGNENPESQTRYSNAQVQIPQDIQKDTIVKNEQIVAKNDVQNPEIPENQVKTPETHSKELKSVNYEQMKKIVGNPDFIIIDARREDDYKKAHIPGSINLFALSEPNEKFEIIMTIPMGKKYVIYCDGGNCDLSHQLATEFLNSFGFTNVYVYEGGWEEWNKKNQ